MQTQFKTWVLELSSFQLESIERMRVNAAAILNLTPDHLDRYASHAEYGQAKARIFLNQQTPDVAVVNADDESVVKLSEQARVPVYGFGQSGGRGRFAGRAYAVEGGFAFDFAEARFAVRNPALRGGHNLFNAMAAALLAFHSGAPVDRIQEGLDAYPGLPHRLERVRTLREVEWINDSKATNVDSVLVALKAFAGGVWLIAGGRGKGAPYGPMVEASLGRVKGVLTIGEDAAAIGAAYHGKIPVHPSQTLETAVARASGLAKAGDVVLLSPACASYDQFKNFEHRGDTFRRLVKGLS
jgi:UDP-N-acetylmuramoylalanine--D-glutamate ligase